MSAPHPCVLERASSAELDRLEAAGDARTRRLVADERSRRAASRKRRKARRARRVAKVADEVLARVDDVPAEQMIAAVDAARTGDRDKVREVLRTLPKAAASRAEAAVLAVAKPPARKKRTARPKRPREVKARKGSAVHPCEAARASSAELAELERQHRASAPTLELLAAEKVRRGGKPTEKPPEQLELLACRRSSPRGPRASEEDLDLRTAQRAYEGVSMWPERRGTSARREYAETFNRWADTQFRGVDADDVGWVEAEVASARLRYLAAFRAFLAAKGRTTSWNITGPAGRNHKAEERKHDTADRRLQDAGAVLAKAGKAIARGLKRRAGERAAAAAGYDVAKFSRAKVEAAAAKGRAAARAAAATQRGASSRVARESAERAAELQARLDATGSKSYPFGAGTRLGLELPAGAVEVDHDAHRVRVRFDERLPRAMYRRVSRGWNWSRRAGAFQRPVTQAAITSAEQISGLELPGLADRFAKIQAASDEAAKQAQAARATRKAAARKGAGSFRDVLDAAMRRGAQFKLEAPASSPVAGKKLSPSVKRVSAGYMLTWRTKESGKSPFGGRAPVPHARRLGIRVHLGEDGSVSAFSNTRSQVGEPVAVGRLVAPSAEDVPRIVASVRELLDVLGDLDAVPSVYAGR